ncbi:MAG TPA: HAMP domain-containing sensor histidine kinase [Streptosporangiaceae bacterium]|nr:HAMP domain-containing sensor histidine kinase [Streptosporangiaceae bacterium]
MLSFRTISGKLIIGLVVLFGLASIVVSVVTAQSLSNSLMSSLRTQVQSATSTWFTCASPDNHSPGGDPDHDQQSPPGCYDSGQAPGTFLAILSSSGKVEQYYYVGGSCTLTAADQAMLLNLPAPDPPGSYPPHGPPPDPQTYTRTLSSLGIEFMFTKVPGPNHTMLVTGLPLTTVNEQLEHVENTEHVLFAVALGLAVILGAGLVQFSLRPLRRVAATATKVTELPLDSGEVTLPAGVPDIDPRTEVGQVGAAFNRMLFHVERALGRRAASEARLRRFAADASHELRTPLSAIRGYAELALRHRGPVPEDVTHALTRVQSESARMSVLVDDLLLLARLDAGRPLEREPVDLSRLAIDVTSDARVARREHHWRLDLPSDPVLVRGDEHRLHQVLANLMSNAGKHTPPGSTVSVALRVDEAPGTRSDSWSAPDGGMVERGVRPAAPRVELSITDDGPGIPPELLPDLFERFTRADTSRARDLDAAGKSTGLGLAIVDAVVAAHGGSITVTSRTGRTRFAIYLPLLPEPADMADIAG